MGSRLSFCYMATQQNKQLFPFTSQLKSIFQSLLTNGDEIRIVGGSVRDFLCNKTISDIDLACIYNPHKTSEILQENNIKTIASGIKYGTITAIVGNEKFQITTLRKDTEGSGRDCEVEFIYDFYQDAKRRDFTINAISIDFANNVYDYFGGRKDLENKIVRFIGNSNQRIEEDHLRILRFFRFSCFYGQNIDRDGLKACIKNKEGITKLSKERIKDEFFKILSCKNRKSLWQILLLMHQIKILDIILQDTSSLVGLENIFWLENILNYQFDEIFLLSAISSQPKFNLSKIEKSHLQNITNPRFAIDFHSSTKDLIKLLIRFDKKEIIETFVLKLSRGTKEILIDDFLRIYKILSNLNIPIFPVNGYHLLAAGVIPANIGKFLKYGQEYWIENDFLVSTEQIIKFILDNYKT